MKYLSQKGSGKFPVSSFAIQWQFFCLMKASDEMFSNFRLCAEKYEKHISNWETFQYNQIAFSNRYTRSSFTLVEWNASSVTRDDNDDDDNILPMRQMQQFCFELKLFSFSKFSTTMSSPERLLNQCLTHKYFPSFHLIKSRCRTQIINK